MGSPHFHDYRYYISKTSKIFPKVHYFQSQCISVVTRWSRLKESLPEEIRNSPKVAEIEKVVSKQMLPPFTFHVFGNAELSREKLIMIKTTPKELDEYMKKSHIHPDSGVNINILYIVTEDTGSSGCKVVDGVLKGLSKLSRDWIENCFVLVDVHERADDAEKFRQHIAVQMTKMKPSCKPVKIVMSGDTCSLPREISEHLTKESIIALNLINSFLSPLQPKSLGLFPPASIVSLVKNALVENLTNVGLLTEMMSRVQRKAKPNVEKESKVKNLLNEDCQKYLANEFVEEFIKKFASILRCQLYDVGPFSREIAGLVLKAMNLEQRLNDEAHDCQSAIDKLTNYVRKENERRPYQGIYSHRHARGKMGQFHESSQLVFQAVDEMLTTMDETLFREVTFAFEDMRQKLIILDRLQFNVEGILSHIYGRPPKRKVNDPTYMKKLQEDLLKISEVVGCGRVFRIMTILVNTLNVRVRTKVQRELQHYGYGFPCEIVHFDKPVVKFANFGIVNGCKIRRKMDTSYGSLGGFMEGDDQHKYAFTSAHVIRPFGYNGDITVEVYLQHEGEFKVFGFNSRKMCVCTGEQVEGDESSTDENGGGDDKSFIPAASGSGTSTEEAGGGGIDNGGPVDEAAAATIVFEKVDVAAIKVDEYKNECENLLQSEDRESLQRWEIHDWDPWSEADDGKPVFIHGAASKKKLDGLIAASRYAMKNETDRNLLEMLGDEQILIAPLPGSNEQFAEPGDSGSFVCMPMLDDNIIEVVSILQGGFEFPGVAPGTAMSSDMKTCVDKLSHKMHITFTPCP